MTERENFYPEEKNHLGVACALSGICYSPCHLCVYVCCRGCDCDVCHDHGLSWRLCLVLDHNGLPDAFWHLGLGDSEKLMLTCLCAYLGTPLDAGISCHLELGIWT